MEREKYTNPNNPKITLAKAFILDEIIFWESILNERRENRIRPGRVDEQILGFIKERNKALESEEALSNYILHRYCACLRRLNEKDFYFSSEEKLKQAVDFLKQLLF